VDLSAIRSGNSGLRGSPLLGISNSSSTISTSSGSGDGGSNSILSAKEEDPAWHYLSSLHGHFCRSIFAELASFRTLHHPTKHNNNNNNNNNNEADQDGEFNEGELDDDEEEDEEEEDGDEDDDDEDEEFNEDEGEEEEYEEEEEEEIDEEDESPRMGRRRRRRRKRRRRSRTNSKSLPGPFGAHERKPTEEVIKGLSVVMLAYLPNLWEVAHAVMIGDLHRVCLFAFFYCYSA